MIYRAISQVASTSIVKVSTTILPPSVTIKCHGKKSMDANGNEELSDRNSITDVNSNSDDIASYLGAKLLWTHCKYRRHRIAQRLLDTARKYYSYGVHYPLSQIAFSQPTSDGLAFALAYTSSDEVIAYT